MAIEAIIDTRDETSRDQSDDAEIVELVSESCYGVGVVLDSVVGCAHSQTDCCAGKETCECIDVRLLDGVISGHDGEVEYYPHYREPDRGN